MDLYVDYTSPTSPTFGDIVFLNGDVEITPDQRTAIAQDIVQRVRTFLGEWFLDNTVGVPYFQQILVKNPDGGEIDALFMDEILATPGVTSLNAFSSALDRSLRQLSVSFSAETTDGQVDYSGTIQV